MNSLTKQQLLVIAGLIAVAVLAITAWFLMSGDTESAAGVGVGGGVAAAEVVRRASRRRQERDEALARADVEVQDQEDRLERLPDSEAVTEDIAALTPDEKANLGNDLL